MCTCIAEIKTSYTKVRKQAEEVANQSFDMDDFLDAIIVVKKELTRVTDETNALVELVRDHFTEITVDEAKELLVLSEPIQKKMQVVYLKLLASPLYVGLETATDLYRQAMSDFDELCHDMKTFNIDLAQDAHFQQTLKMVSEMMHRWSSTQQVHFGKLLHPYYVSLISDDVALLRIYPKRGPQGIVDIVDEEYDRLLLEMVTENNNNTLHQVDIKNSLAELDTKANMF